MWFEYKKSVAPVYQDETYRRLFATASGRRKQVGREKEGEAEDDKPQGWRARWARWMRSDKADA
jgi:hypothetical protein